jgi:hypothetical protein
MKICDNCFLFISGEPYYCNNLSLCFSCFEKMIGYQESVPSINNDIPEPACSECGHINGNHLDHCKLNKRNKSQIMEEFQKLYGAMFEAGDFEKAQSLMDEMYEAGRQRELDIKAANK